MPDDAEIGIDVGQFGQLSLLAVLEGNNPDMWILALGAIPYPAEKPMLDELRAEMQKRLQQMDQPEKGVMIVTARILSTPIVKIGTRPSSSRSNQGL